MKTILKYVYTTTLIAVSGLALAAAPAGPPAVYKTKLAKTTKVTLVEGASWSTYQAVSLVPATVKCDAGVQRKDCEAVGREFDKSMRTALDKRHLAVQGEPVLLLRPVVLDVNPANGLANAVAVAAIGIPLDKGGLKLSVELVDAKTLVPLGTIEAGGNASLFNPLTGMRSIKRLGHAKLVGRRVAKEVAGLVAELTPAGLKP